MKKSYVYIDPQSYLNLAIYDYGLLSHIDGDVHYACSTLYDYKPLPANVRQHRLFKYSLFKHKAAKAISYMSTCILLGFRLLCWHPSVVHVQWLRIPSFDYRYYWLLKKMLGCRLVFTAHNILPHDSGTRYLKSFQAFYQLTDAIIVHTEATKEELLSTFKLQGDKVHVIAHGLLQIKFDPQLLSQKQKEYDDHYRLDGKMVFSALGYQCQYKGVDIIAQVWASTPELCQNSQCKLLLIGKNHGVDLSALDGVSNAIVEDRMVSDEEFFYLLRHTDVYLLPSRSISQSGVLLTAIATETPVLVTDIGGLTDPLKVAPVGWQMPQLSADALKKHLLWLLEHPDEVRKVKENHDNWSKLRDYYSWERIGTLTQQLYSALSERGQ